MTTSQVTIFLLIIGFAVVVSISVVKFNPEFISHISISDFVPGKKTYVLGEPTLTAGEINEILASYDSLAQGYGEFILERGKHYNIKPEVLLAFFAKESTMANPDVYTWVGWIDRSSSDKSEWKSTCNVGNIRGYDENTHKGFVDYNKKSYREDWDCWQNGIEGFYKLIRDYTDGNVIKDRFGNRLYLTTVEEILPYYAPSIENNTKDYISFVQRFIYKYAS